MRVLLLGSAGQLGHELEHELRSSRPIDLAVPSRAELDIGDALAVRRALDFLRPHVIINATAYNDVDGAETHAETAFSINATAVARLGEQALERRAALITYSSDFVFDGAKGTPYAENDAPNPLSVYGRSKLAGEEALRELSAPAIVLRTAWVYSLRRKNFVLTILKLARERPDLRVVADQFGSPTAASDLALATLRLLGCLGRDLFEAALEHRGVYHAAAQGFCSRHQLAVAALELDPRADEHMARSVVPTSTVDGSSPARRPTFGALDSGIIHAKFGIRLPAWRDGLAALLGGQRRDAPLG